VGIKEGGIVEAVAEFAGENGLELVESPELLYGGWAVVGAGVA
jgi:hypothetical protein